ncbi:biotin/lipoyl-containing protein [Sphingorhabdus sp. Alg231-15]|uniref:biotin/lipoyl-containing protein n=1 Tax=Sphingorhabdus sp. Alg231-15 TaxID=1922222 RepID=UPI000D554426
MTDIVVAEDLYTEDGPAVISSWLYDDGDRVGAGSIIVEIMYEKTSFEIAAPADGVLSILAQTEEEVARGQCIGRIIDG